MATRMQHDLFVHPDVRLRRAFPLVVLLQSDIAGGDQRIVAPMTPIGLAPRLPSRQVPIVRHDETNYSVFMPLMTTVSARALRRPVGSIAAWRDDISRALDWLFFGI